jgi:mycoredoxin
MTVGNQMRDPAGNGAGFACSSAREDTYRAKNAPALTIYSTTWCGYCRRLKTQLNASGIEYTEIDIENDPAAADFVGSVNGGNHVVPTVKYGDGSVATNPSLNQVKQALGL